MRAAGRLSCITTGSCPCGDSIATEALSVRDARTHAGRSACCLVTEYAGGAILLSSSVGDDPFTPAVTRRDFSGGAALNRGDELIPTNADGFNRPVPECYPTATTLSHPAGPEIRCAGPGIALCGRVSVSLGGVSPEPAGYSPRSSRPRGIAASPEAGYRFGAGGTSGRPVGRALPGRRL